MTSAIKNPSVFRSCQVVIMLVCDLSKLLTSPIAVLSTSVSQFVPGYLCPVFADLTILCKRLSWTFVAFGSMMYGLLTNSVCPACRRLIIWCSQGVTLQKVGFEACKYFNFKYFPCCACNRKSMTGLETRWNLEGILFAFIV